jgi:hypothetical protein
VLADEGHYPAFGIFGFTGLMLQRGGMTADCHANRAWLFAARSGVAVFQAFFAIAHVLVQLIHVRAKDE